MERSWVNMKTLIVALFLLMTFKVLADQDGGPCAYSFVTLSPHREYYLVQVLHSWSFERDTNNIGRSRLDYVGRFEVCRSIDGERLWQTNTVLGMAGGIHLSDDPDYVVVMDEDLDSCGLSCLHGGGLSNAPPEKLKEIFNQPVLRFFKRGSLLSTHTLNTLDVHQESLGLSVSHIQYFDLLSAGARGHWDWPIDDLIVRVNPSFDKIAHTFSFFGKDNRERVFDYTSGKLIRMDSQEDADARMKPFRERMQFYELNRATNSPKSKSKGDDDPFK